RPGMTVVDYCAGGGGKTLALAQSMSSSRPQRSGEPGPRQAAPPAAVPDSGSAASGMTGQLIACDVDRRRLDNIRPRLARAGVEADLRLLGQNGGGVEDLNGQADLVFVDAPCGGSGAWRRRPEDAWRQTAADVARLHALQVRILGQAARLVRPGGRLVYVTCSLLAAENEASADAFEADHPDFRPLPVAEALDTPRVTEAGRERLAELAGGGHRLRLSPAATHTDGFF